MYQTAKNKSRGISVLEILIALCMLVVIVSFAAPTLSSVNAKADLQAAVANMEFSIDAARNTARVLETPVVMNFHNDRKLKQNYITFSMPQRSEQLQADNSLQRYDLPAGIRIVSDQTVIQFDSRGLLEAPVQLLLASQADEDVSERLLIQ